MNNSRESTPEQTEDVDVSASKTETASARKRSPLLSRIRIKHVVVALLLWTLMAFASLAFGAIEAQRAVTACNELKKDAKQSQRNALNIRQNLRTCNKRLTRANRAIDNFATYPLRAIPRVNTQLISADKLTTLGANTTDAAYQSLIRLDTRYPGLLSQESEGAFASTQNKGQLLTDIANELTTARKAMGNLDLGPSRHLLPPLADARKQAQTYVLPLDDGLTRAAAGANAFASLFRDQKSYLVFAANTTEMRSGSGMFLSVGELRTGNNTIAMSTMRHASSITAEKGAVKWPQQLDERWGFMKLTNMVQDLMLSPRFDVAAPIASEIWQKSQGTSPDGVLVVDTTFLKAVLKSTGPLTVDGFTFTADNVMQQLNYEQYARLESSVNDQIREQGVSSMAEAQQLLAKAMSNNERRDLQAALAAAAFARIAEGKWSSANFITEFANVVDGRHFLAWSKDPTTNENWRKAWASGELTENSMLLSAINLGANKLDQFLDMRANLESKETSDGYDLALTVNVRNNAPKDGPRYVLGPFLGSGLESGEYNGVLSLNMPGDATNVRVDGNPKLLSYGADGPTGVIGIYYRAKRGENNQYVIRWHRPKTANSFVIEPSARIPATLWTYGNKSWRDDHTVFTSTKTPDN